MEIGRRVGGNSALSRCCVCTSKRVYFRAPRISCEGSYNRDQSTLLICCSSLYKPYYPCIEERAVVGGIYNVVRTSNGMGISHHNDSDAPWRQRRPQCTRARRVDPRSTNTRRCDPTAALHFPRETPYQKAAAPTSSRKAARKDMSTRV